MNLMSKRFLGACMSAKVVSGLRGAKNQIPSPSLTPEERAPKAPTVTDEQIFLEERHNLNIGHIVFVSRFIFIVLVWIGGQKI